MWKLIKWLNGISEHVPTGNEYQWMKSHFVVIWKKSNHNNYIVHCTSMKNLESTHGGKQQHPANVRNVFFFDRTIAWHNQITQKCNVDLILWAERQKKKNDWIMIYFKAEISSACLLASWSDNVQLKFNGCNWAMPADKIQQTKKFIRYVWNI